MNDGDKIEIARAIGGLEASVEALGERLGHIEANRDRHLKAIYGRLDALDARANVGKGTMAAVGWIVVSIGTVIAAAVGAAVGRLMPS